MLNVSVASLYAQWLSNLPVGDPLREELTAAAGDENDLTDRFYQEIVFGTAGLRGICGAGTNRMNRLTVGRATQGIANYIRAAGCGEGDTSPASRGVVIAYDCRYHSREFSELSAEILAGNGIRCYLFPSLRPTPELSFAIRRLHAISGINMTASHNPKEYNGYKVYWEDGAQISGAVSDGMLREIQALDFFDDPPALLPLDEAIAKGLIVMLGEEMDRAYLDYVLSMAQRPDDELDRTVPIVYTPLNGAGSIPLSRVMARRGFRNFYIVPEQKDPDPEFSTVGYPNPEDPQAFRLAEQLGRKTGAEVLIATDPDSDRMAIEIPDGAGGYRPLSGNQAGALLIAYMAESLAAAGKLPAAPAAGDKKAALSPPRQSGESIETGFGSATVQYAMIQSIVTGDLGRRICESYGIEVFDALTGFKNICGRIPDLEAKGYTYFFGYEESIGCAPGAEVRDKDGICAGMLIGEMAAYYRKKGLTIADALEALYRRYGYYAEHPVSVVLKGAEGAARIERIMETFRNEPVIGSLPVREVIDYIDGYHPDGGNGCRDVPASNVLRFTMEDGSWFAMRPSGTEPKIKFYYYAVADTPDASREIVETLVNAVMEKLDTIA